MEKNMSNSENADMHQVQDQSEKQTSETVANVSVGLSAAYADAIADAIRDADPDLESVLPLQPKLRRGKYQRVINKDKNRPVTFYNANTENNVIFLTRISKSEGEGATIYFKNVAAVFGAEVFTAPDRTQVEIIMSNGQSLYGYILVPAVNSKAAAKFYLPKGNMPDGIELPTLGYNLPVVVSKLIVG